MVQVKHVAGYTASSADAYYMYEACLTVTPSPEPFTLGIGKETNVKC